MVYRGIKDGVGTLKSKVKGEKGEWTSVPTRGGTRGRVLMVPKVHKEGKRHRTRFSP